ncbi:type IV-A pilus assembly ATPase PilB [Spiribacter sp. 2438]|uniref:GspE/PulE family protein n=1 Tax=Spiribacter sp. 2438 TaxID=2666185 RepID=UPI0012AF2F4F|nr:ATPase, T2SS/T4P/T4SS family [Spiribacter sp. 2438]QGM22136.1 type IV-A pilus assembly ATPase PilB [Spiribacter sp. 2438]
MSRVPTRPALSRELIAEGLITAESMDDAQQAARAAGIPLMQHLLDSGLIPAAELAEVAAGVFDMPLVPADALHPRPEFIHQLEPELLRRHRALPLDQHNGYLRVAVSDPANIQALDEIRFHTGLPTIAVLAEDDALGDRINQMLGPMDQDLGDDRAMEVRDSEPRLASDTPVVRYVNRLMLRAVREGASDIHIEPFEHSCRIRFRQDGQLHEVATPNAAMASRLSSRLKVMARLDIAEKRLPQDGRLRLATSGNGPVDFRLSVCPTLHGEKLVLRLLNSATGQLAITDIGLSQAQLHQYRRALHAAHGMILVTGPTGSGKTVTLYSGLRELNDPTRNILSVEDPVEINLPGVNQVSINPRIGLDFAQVLRSFLRQDPDIIMVGEIRDRETAEIAIKAAQTGHLVLSTLHTNDAAGAVTRLINMGIPPWSIAASINLIIAQRLVRRCGDQGGSGRIGIHECLPVDGDIATAINDGETATAINRLARARGLPDLRQSAQEKVRQGLVSATEVERALGSS